MVANPIVTIVGARPNFMKAAPIDAAFRARGIAHEIIHTGQHYDLSLSKVFFDDLGMPEPSVYLGVGSGSHAEQTARVMVGLEKVFEDKKPRLVNVVGDVNSTMAAAIVAAKAHIPVAHTEAGLRSFDMRMPEEVNRRVTDALSNLFLTPSEDADENLRREGHPDEAIVCVGNVMIDTLFRHREAAEKLRVPARLGLSPGGYGVVTLHRPSNVDDLSTLTSLLEVIREIAESLPLVLPLHPRTRARLSEFGLLDDLQVSQAILLVEPMGYLDFLSLTSRSRMVMTDSGGLQEETSAMGIPCLTLRENTERPITVDLGSNVLVGTDPERIRTEARRVLGVDLKPRNPIPLWDGQAAGRIVDAIVRYLEG
jgi:UDP-N-acetylglucosamine 2-epimerase (non-hydrolysing)